jgi:hypothetical protein
MTHLLLTGAGFSKNWGGLLASEVFNDLLSAGELDQATRDMAGRADHRDRRKLDARQLCHAE